MSRRSRLLLLSETLSEGGAERFASTLLVHLDRGRFEPALCLLRDAVTYPLPADIPVAVLDHRGPGTITRTVRRLGRLVDRFAPDVVLSNIAYTSQFAGPALRRRPGPRWIARVGNDPRTSGGLWGVLTRLWLRRAYRRADGFVANSRGLARAFERFHPSAAGRTTAIGNPVDFAALDRLAAEPPDLRADPRTPLLISVSRLHPNKRPDVLLDAFGRIRQRHPAALWLCGDGPLRDEVQETVTDRGWAEDVRLLGFRDNPFPLLRQATLFLLTSDHEGSPNALIEAQGLGVPAVATRCPYGPDEILDDHKTGRLVETGNPEAIADAVCELLEDPPRLEALGRQAAAHTRRFATHHIIPAWEKLLLESPHGPPTP